MNKNTVETIRQAIKENPQQYPMLLAKDLGVSEWDVIKELGAENFTQVPIECFETIMHEVTSWGPITFIVTNDTVISEVKAELPNGSYAYGYYNFEHSKLGIGGHINKDALGGIGFVSRPFMGLESLSIQFFDKEGKSMFKIYLGRDEKKQIVRHQRDSYLRLKESLQHTGIQSSKRA
ncbi:heme utilization cystosolic carrier protein HutX [Selenomonadales bacterium OttesenSCG-928-I06]|nr:heme utilization cystosolic carrier protein HutX [Selenomonadales bacterium OttesenSCG-928-I06]